jgi:hypothetical protein
MLKNKRRKQTRAEQKMRRAKYRAAMPMNSWMPPLSPEEREYQRKMTGIENALASVMFGPKDGYDDCEWDTIIEVMERRALAMFGPKDNSEDYEIHEWEAVRDSILAARAGAAEDEPRSPGTSH